MAKYPFALIISVAFIVTNFGLSPGTNGLPEGAPKPADFDTIRTNLHDYIWPTDASMRITSSFAEYRTTHFHGGLDISTNGQTGYKVFAVRDGYIYRIRVMPNDYGRMLFVKHKDGYVTTYAHLQRFNETITKVAREEQYRLGKFGVDLILEPQRLPVHQGDVIAYTGESGVGPPHLHFELRDENLNMVNPLLVTSYNIPDHIAPSIHRIMVEPLGYGSLVDNDNVPKYFSRFPRSRGGLTIPQTIRVHGDIGFGVDAEDRFDGSSSHAGIYRIEFFIDDSLRYSMELNRVPADDTKEIDLHYDLASLVDGRGKFEKLYIETGNRLPFYRHQPEGTGILHTDQLTEGIHNYRIACLDFHGNRTELRGTMLANHEPKLAIASVNDGEVVLNGPNINSIAECFVYGKRAFQSSWTQHSLLKGRYTVVNGQLELPVNTKPYDVIKVIAETRSGSHSQPMFYFLKKQQGPARDIHVTTDILHDYVRFTLTTPGVFTSPPSLTVEEGSLRRTVALNAVDVNKYTGAFVPADRVEGRRIALVEAEVNGRPTRATNEFVLYSIPSRASGKFTTLTGDVTVSYDSSAVFKPLFMTTETEQTRQSTIVSLQPQDVLLNKGITVSLPVRSATESDHLGLYFRSRYGWIFQTANMDSARGTMSTTLTRMLGELTIMKDDVPPSFSRVHVQARKGALSVAFRYFDNLSGVDPDEIKLYVDGSLRIPELDGEHRKAYYQGDEPLSRGKHSLRIVMKDRMKNTAEITRVLSVR